MNLSKMAQGICGLSSSQILLSEERCLFSIIESIVTLLKEPEQYSNYYHCLINLISFDISEPHSEPITRKVMDVITSQIKVSQLPLSVLLAIIPNIFKQV